MDKEQDRELRRLLHCVADGDAKAFRTLYKATSARLFAIALTMLRRRDAAEDVLQDAFVQVWHRAGDYHADRGSVSAWLSTIVRYRAIDQLRKRRDDVPFDESPDDIHPDDPESLTGPLNLAIAADDSSFLTRCLDRLTDAQKQSIALAFFRGMTHAELAQSTSLPLGTIKSRLRRSLLRLKECLEAIGFKNEIPTRTG